MAAVSEALALGRRLGLDPKVLTEVRAQTSPRSLLPPSAVGATRLPLCAPRAGRC